MTKLIWRIMIFFLVGYMSFAAITHFKVHLLFGKFLSVAGTW